MAQYEEYPNARKYKTKDGIEYTVIPEKNTPDNDILNEVESEEYIDGEYDKDIDYQKLEADDYAKVYPSSKKSKYKYETVRFKERYTGVDFQYSEIKPAPPKNINLPNLAPLVQIIFYLFCGLAIALVIFLLYKFISTLDLNTKPRLKPITYSDTEVDMPEKVEIGSQELAAQIAAAKANNDFTTATRLYFLWYLQKLQQKEIIRYHHDKTNADYLSEITAEHIIPQFLKVSYLYEFVWYGKKPIDISSFTRIETIFAEQLAVLK